MQEYIATFYTHFAATHFALRLKAQGVEHALRPVPRRLSSSCGTCVYFTAAHAAPYFDEEDLEGMYQLGATPERIFQG